MVEGTVSVLIMTPDCLIAGRDKFGRLPIHVGQDDEGCCVAFESFAYQKMGYHDAYELGPAEVVKITERGWETLLPAEKEMKVCAFLWTYYGYPNSNYEGVNVEVMRNRNGVSLAKTDREKAEALSLCYQWIDENAKQNKAVPILGWTPYDHPQLGKVEIGGPDFKFTWQNCPIGFLEQEVEKNTNWPQNSRPRGSTMSLPCCSTPDTCPPLSATRPKPSGWTIR